MRYKQEKEKIDKITHSIARILEELGWNLEDENLKDTPVRVARTWIEEMSAPNLSNAPKDLLATFSEDYDQMVVLVGHKTYTFCPHHLERVTLEVTIGYIPNGKIIGLSKLARVADYLAKGLQLQEGYTQAVASFLHKHLNPLGVGVYVKGNHMCMQARGVKTDGYVITTALKGAFLEDGVVRNEFLKYMP